ncbi:EamA family transporter [Alcaligenes sp. 13f]|uniref:DMT family transporter n=1 Tax=Alcaligenes sp. 13f TaxID=2841924 RepID=UPI001CF6DDAA|nr:EamA family transporter [Alcaligenes sp. 13f]MCB4321416.1 EamA family transporter [Alcaligenes sp. 13f]
MTASSKDHLFGVAGVLVAAVLWGTTGVSATFAPEVGAVAIGAAAMGVGGLLQAGIATRAIARHASALRMQWHWLLLGALAVAIYPLAFYGSMRLAGVTVGTVVSIGSAPLLSALIEMVMDGLRVSTRWVIGAGFGLLGMALLCIAESSGHSAVTAAPSIMLGVALGLLAGLTYALYSWAARRLMQRQIPARAAMGATFGIGGLLLMPVLFATGAPFLASWNNAAVGIYMALVPMFLGYVCFGYGLARIQASTATTITLVEPVVAAALAALIVGERLPAMGWVGVALIFACLVCITLPLRSRGRTSPVSSTHPA